MNPLIESIVQLSKQHRVVEIVYRKSAFDGDAKSRLVEPYNFTEGKQDLMIRCYQLVPEEGWRFFMCHKIASCRDGGSDFKPRDTVNLATGEVDTPLRPAEEWTSGRRAYRDLISDALADGKLSKSENDAIRVLVKRERLDMNDIRFVHAAIYHRCLGAIIEDGTVDDDEIAQIRFVQKVLSFLGWSPGEKVRGKVLTDRSR